MYEVNVILETEYTNMPILGGDSFSRGMPIDVAVDFQEKVDHVWHVVAWGNSKNKKKQKKTHHGTITLQYQCTQWLPIK